LPLGPVIVNPDGLIKSFTLEVIKKRPFDFKIDCLNTIKDLFPNKNPFVAGFGNRETDVITYRSIGILD
jgi:phosphatidate phosphatase LPIN